ncbi:MAG: STAS domain-containing protein [Terriglobia bacterium]
MQLTINTQEKQGAVVMTLNGRFVSGEECEAFRTKIKGFLANNQTRIVLDLAEVVRVDSTGIGASVEAVILTARAGGQLKLTRVPRLIRNILSTHRLLQAFEIYDTEDAALASFDAPAHQAAS